MIYIEGKDGVEKMNKNPIEYIDRELAELALFEAENECAGMDEKTVENIFALAKNKLDSVQKADVAPVVRRNWGISEIDLGFCEAIGRDYKMKKYSCPVCGYETGTQAEKFICCPICTARMDGDSDA